MKPNTLNRSLNIISFLDYAPDVAGNNTVDAARLAEAVQRFVRSEASFDVLDRCAGGTWLAGGCGILARAVLHFCDSSDVTILGIVSAVGLEHLGVEVGDLVIDAKNGYRSRNRWHREFQRRERIIGTRVVEIDASKVDSVCSDNGIVWDGGSDDAAILLETIYDASLNAYRGTRGFFRNATSITDDDARSRTR